jgi:prepilin-type N-terminal cleavage/methylation domain-containing protein
MTGRERPTPAEQGFTLIEMLIALTVTAIVTGTIATALVVTFRTVGAANDQVAQSHDAQNLSFWLLPDLQSLGPTPSPDTTHTSGPSPNHCTGSAPGGTYVVNMSWTDTSPPGVTYQADYFTAADSSGQLVLNRYYCSTANPTPTVLPIVHHVSSAAGSVTFTIGSPSCPLATMTVTTLGPANSPYTFSVCGWGR